MVYLTWIIRSKTLPTIAKKALWTFAMHLSILPCKDTQIKHNTNYSIVVKIVYILDILRVVIIVYNVVTIYILVSLQCDYPLCSTIYSAVTLCVLQSTVW